MHIVLSEIANSPAAFAFAVSGNLDKFQISLQKELKIKPKNRDFKSMKVQNLYMDSSVCEKHALIWIPANAFLQRRAMRSE